MCVWVKTAPVCGKHPNVAVQGGSPFLPAYTGVKQGKGISPGWLSTSRSIPVQKLAATPGSPSALFFTCQLCFISPTDLFVLLWCVEGHPVRSGNKRRHISFFSFFIWGLWKKINKYYACVDTRVHTHTPLLKDCIRLMR